jgi:hypothetical protein
MNNQLSKDQEIDRYLSGAFTNEERADFEARMQTEATLKEDVELTRKLISGIRGYAFKQMIGTIMEEEFGPKGTRS